MRIKDTSLRQVLQSVDVAEVVGDYLTLKRRGRNLLARCPFHDERTPSFNVNPDLGIYKCFGCGKAGDSVSFLMELEGMTFVQAIEHLAAKYHIGLEYDEGPADEDKAIATERESLLVALQFAQGYYAEVLKTSPEGKAIAQPYLRERGLLPASWEAYGIGWAPDGRDVFYKHALKNGFQKDILEKAGLVMTREDGSVLDRFRARLIFPIHNPSGKVLGFGGRTLVKDERTPKYINSPETAVYNKSQVLYGLYQARQAIRKQQHCFLTEGYMDVVQMHQAGIGNVVAASGTSLTKEQCRLLGRQTESVTVLFDSDPAGQKAAFRGIDLLLEEGLQVRVLTLPEKHDPDSYLKAFGSQAFLDYAQASTTDFVSFKVKLLSAEAGHDAFKRAALISEVVRTINLIPDAISRQVFYRESARLMDMPEESLQAEAKRLQLNKKRDDQKAARREEGYSPAPGEMPPGQFDPEEDGALPLGDLLEKPRTLAEQIEALERESLWVLLQWHQHEVQPGSPLPDYLLDETADVDFQTPLLAKAFKLARQVAHEGKRPGPEDFLQLPDTELRSLAADLLARELSISPGWATKGIESSITGGSVVKQTYWHIMRLKHGVVRQRLEELTQKVNACGDADEQMALVKELLEIKQLDTLLSQQLGRVVNA